MGLNKKDKTPLISVIMPVFNCEKYVDQAIKSILDQTTEDFELIISDDGSTDGSRSILDDYARKDMRIQLSHNEFNQGKVNTVNRLFEKCKGEYVTIHDADDWSEKERFGKFIQFFDEHPEYMLVGSSYANIAANGKVLSISTMSYNYGDIKKNIGVINKIHGPTIFFKRQIPEIINGLFRDVRMGEDIDFIWRVAEKFNVTNINEVLYNYRIHNNSMTKSYKHDVKSKIRDRKVIISLAKQRREKGSDVLMEDDIYAYNLLLKRIENEYDKESFKYINEYTSYLLHYNMKAGAIKFIFYNIFKEGISLPKVKLLIHTLLFR